MLKLAGYLRHYNFNISLTEHSVFIPIDKIDNIVILKGKTLKHFHKTNQHVRSNNKTKQKHLDPLCEFYFSTFKSEKESKFQFT